VRPGKKLHAPVGVPPSGLLTSLRLLVQCLPPATTRRTGGRQDLFNDAQATLAIVGVLPNSEVYGVGKKVIAELLDKGEISLEAYNGIIGNQKTADTMLRENLFLYHLRTGRITFQSAPIEQYCRAKYGSGRQDD
jgi:hypothetical protein